MKKLNIDEVAQLAGVSTATVSRVLNDYPFVKEETRSKVLKVITETNYRVNAVARNLRRRKTHSIGVIISNVLSSFYAVIAKAVEDVALRNQFSTVLCNGGDDPEKELNYLKILYENRVDGIILSPTGKNKDYLEFLLASGIPIAMIDRTVDGLQCDAVLVNNREASYSAVQYLLARGYRKIGFISGPNDRLTGLERRKGYWDAFREAAVTIDEQLIRIGDFTLESGEAIARELIENVPIDALYIANSDMATGAYHVIKQKELKIPEEIALLIFDDPDWTTLVTPKVSAIRQPVYMLGSTAADLLFKRIFEGGSSLDRELVKVILEAQMIKRESV